jgi:HK97 family phage prohead protease
MPFEVTRAETDGDGLTLEGYAAVWDSPTEINSVREGNFIERIKPGAFKRTLNAKMPVLMFNHGQHPLIGDMPLGKIEEAREDVRGLFIRARLSDNWLVQPVRDAIAAQAVSGMSFRMSIPENGDTWRKPATRDGLPERDISEIKCYELGPVVFPAYEETTVGVRSAEILEALTDPDVRSDLARAMFISEQVPDTRMADTEAAQLALRDAIKLHQSLMAGLEPVNEASQQQLLNHLLNARAAISGGVMEMKSEEIDTEPVIEDDTSEEPDPTDEVTPRGASDPARVLTRLVIANDLPGVMKT